MLLHDNYILFLVNLKAVLKLRCKVKCTYCLLYEECIFVMAESDKTLKEDVNLSNNSRNNSVPNIVPISSGTVNSDTHPTHHAAVSEPSTLKRKQTSFQITSVTVKGSRLSTDGGEDSADDLDESHTEDASSDILDCSRNTDVDNDQFSEDNTANHDDGSCTAPSTAVKSKREMPDKKVTSNDVVKLPSGALTSEELSMPSETTQSDYVKPTALPDQWQHRFRVVKIVSSEPFKRGRWLCLDFVDPPAPVTEAKAEIVESSVSPNIQLISSSLPESIPADKIAHIYEISPGDAYPGSISVAVGSDKVQQPMYGIFLPINNGQYPLITGMHSKAVARPMDKEVHESMKPVQSSEQGNQSQCLVSSAQPTPNISSAMQNSMNVTPNLQQTQQNFPVGSNINTASNYQQQQNISSSNYQQQQNISSSNFQQPQTISLSNFQPQQNISSSVQAMNNCMPQQPTTSTAQQPCVSGIHQNLSTNVGQQSIPTQQASSAASNMQQQQMATSTNLTEVKSVQSQNINSGMLPPQHNVHLQSQQNVNASVQSAQNISSNMPQSTGSSIQQNVNTSMQSHPNMSNNVEMQYQNVGNVHLPPNVNNIQSQPNASSVPSQQNASTAQQPKVGGNLTSQHVSSHLNQHDSSSVQQASIPQQPQSTPIGLQQTQNVMEGFQHAQTTMGNLQHAHTSQQPQNASVSQSGNETHQVLVNQPMQQGITFQQQQQPKPVQPIPAMQNVSVSQSSNVDPKLVTQHPSSSSELAPPHSLNIASNVSQVQLSRESQQGMQVSHPVHSTTSQAASSTVSNTPLEVSSAPLMADVAHVSANQSTPMQAQQSVAQTTTVGTQASSVSIPEISTVPSGVKQETVVPSQAVQNHIEAKELGTPTSANVQGSQESAEVPSSKSDINGEESESVPSGTSTVAIDNKIEQAMDLVKSHLMFAVREEVDVLKEKITELMDRISQLEYENSYLRANASQQTLEQLNQSQLLQQQQNQPLTVSMNTIPAVSQQSLQQTQINIQNQQPTS